jgi:hypothetical protein
MDVDVPQSGQGEADAAPGVDHVPDRAAEEEALVPGEILPRLVAPFGQKEEVEARNGRYRKTQRNPAIDPG